MNRLPTRPRIDPGLVFCLLLTLFVVLPVAQHSGLPQGAETLLHIQRLDEPPRGHSDGDGGLTYLFAAIFQRLFSLSAIEAWRGLLLLCYALCSGGMYAFCKRRSGRLGALIAGLVYVYSPALMHNEPYARGAYPELLALALFPLLLWRIDALRDKPTPVSFLLVWLLQAAMLHTRLATALTLAGIALVWLIFETLIQRLNREASQMWAGAGALAALAVLLGILAGAGLWLPVLPTITLEFSGGIMYLEYLFSAPPIHDAGAINGLRELPTLGLAQWALAITGALAALLLYIGGFRTRHPQSFLGTALFAGLALLLIALMLPYAADWWRGSPLLHQLGAPSRLLGPTTACLAIVASMNGLWLGRIKSPYQSSTIALLVASPIVTIIPLLYVPAPQSSLATATVELGASSELAAAEIALLVSAAALVLAGVIAWRLRHWQLTPRPYWTAPTLSRTSLIGVLLGGAIALFSLLITFREGIAWTHSPPGQALPAKVQRVQAIGEDLQLLGYDLNADVFRSGDRLVFKAYWYAHERPTVDYSSFLRLSPAGSPPRLLARKQHPADLPTSEAWGPGGYIVDIYDLRLPVDLPAGEYDLIIGLYVCGEAPLDECAAGIQATEGDEKNTGLGGSAVITTIQVVAS